VSAYHTNDSYIDIAKVEGGATYKAYMLGLREEPVNVVSAPYCSFPQWVCQYWPFKSVRPLNPLAPILKALVTSADSALEMTVKSVAVSAYDIGTIDHESARNDVNAALEGPGVYCYGNLDHVARQLAPALGIRGNCSEPHVPPNDPAYHEDPARIYLTVEYTRDAMTAGLWTEECGVMEMTRRLNSVQLGHNAMQTCRETARNKTACEEILTSAMRSVSQDPSRDKNEEIGLALVFGECADDGFMLDAVRQVLKEQFPNGDSLDLSRVRNFSPDPAFAGSRAMAEAVWAAHGREYDSHHADEL
jgi:hypothetical protein